MVGAVVVSLAGNFVPKIALLFFSQLGARHTLAAEAVRERELLVAGGS